MSESLFQNVIVTHVQQDRLRAILAHPENLPLWDNEIMQVIPPTNGEVQLARRPPALNDHEWVTVTAATDQVIYRSHGGRLAYELVFTLTGATLTEELWITQKSTISIPLRLLAPIAKQAFAQKLQALIALAESTKKVVA